MSLETSVRDALSALLTSAGRPLAVVDSDDRVQGLVTLELVEQLLADEAAVS